MKGILWAVIRKPVEIERRFPNGEPHHITLFYGIDKATYPKLIGCEFEALVWQEAWNDRVQALKVMLPYYIPHQITKPHITVSWANGAQPVESNEMLDGEYESRKVTSQIVPCRIEFYEWESVAPVEEGDR
jgi:hypothetical protein